MKKFIKYSKSPFFIEKSKVPFNWHDWILSCDDFNQRERELSHTNIVERLLKLLSYGNVPGYKDPGSEYSLISFADVSNPADYETPDGRKNPFVLDYEFLYLSSNYRAKESWAIIEDQLPKKENGFVNQHLPPHEDYCMSMYEFHQIMERQFKNQTESILASLNYFYVRSNTGFPFRIKVYYQRKTLKRYPKAVYDLYTPILGFDLFDSTHNNIAGSRVFFSCGNYSFTPKENAS